MCERESLSQCQCFFLKFKLINLFIYLNSFLGVTFRQNVKNKIKKENTLSHNYALFFLNFFFPIFKIKLILEKKNSPKLDSDF